jgi:hypothetical protein
VDDREFFDHLLQLWFKTTGAEDRYWMPEPFTDGSGRFNLYAVAENETRKLVASGLNERDADFISGIHGCLFDLHRRIHEALDEADRSDYGRDSRECRMAELELELIELKDVIQRLSQDPPWKGKP